LSELGTIEGNVHVGNVMLNGTVVGDVIAANRVELAPKARITGTLTYSLLEMSMGAEVNGKLIHAAEEEPRKLEFDGNKKEETTKAKPVAENKTPETANAEQGSDNT
ncbi:MAG: polymer-forming cytoskeletal protein, partial [Candidatus Thiodiazotropha sp.]